MWTWQREKSFFETIEALVLRWYPWICGNTCATWMMGLRGLDGSAGGEGRPWKNCFLTGFSPPGCRHWCSERNKGIFTFYSHLFNWSVRLDQSFFSRSTNSGFSMFLMIMCLLSSSTCICDKLVNHLVPRQCTWRQGNSGDFWTWPWTTFTMTTEPITIMAQLHKVHRVICLSRL